ncbi:helix-hairpin-helix domain-containing protein [Salinirarus marinus]|uniref:helix-hairpin-helix domain-containing protein n=1 Tax=Salinirarus marinus TaxID=3068310 RepID=UPI003C6C66FE
MIERIEDLDGIGDTKAKRLREKGFRTVDDLRRASVEELMRADGIGDALAERIKSQVGEATSEATERTGKRPDVTASEWSVTERQAEHLSKLTRTDSADLIGRAAGDVRGRLEELLDPELLFSRRICGRVVKRNPEAGEDDPESEKWHPVPHATVHVEDTDASFLGYFPEDTIYGWLFPFGPQREEIATVTTDECGKFCVSVPRWDIDRVVSHRRERVCLPELVVPRLRDVLEDPRVLPDPVRPPRPGPDPGPLRLDSPGAFDRVSELVGRETALRLDRSEGQATFGESRRALRAFLDRPAFPEPIRPPLPDDLPEPSPEKRVEALNGRLPVDPDVLEAVDFDRFVGPVLRCRDVVVPEWTTLVDVPDITFRVTQDVDGDGTEETIYSEGYFEVRWDETPDDVVLEASGDAISTPTCHGLTPENLECETPSIETVGTMPARSPHHDRSSGYARRINRPKEPDGDRPVAETPYAGTLQLHGCHRFEEASHYRLVYEYEGNDQQAFTGNEWYAPAIGRESVHVQPADPQGWYPVLDEAYLESYYGEALSDNPLLFPYWMLNWNTRRYPDGEYAVSLQLGDDDRNVLDETGPVSLVVDNSRPATSISSIRWGPASTPRSNWTDISSACPVIRRAADTPVRIAVSFTASASHFRDVSLAMYGCEDDPTRVDPARPAGTARANEYTYWHQSTSDDSHSRTVVFEVPASSPEGAYRVALRANSRAFTPGGGAGPGSNWRFDAIDVWSHTSRGISIVDR